MPVLGVPDGKSAVSITEACGRLNIWEGSVRSSKTVSANIAWLLFVASCQEGPLLMTGKTRDTVHRNIIDPISEWMPEEDFKPHLNNVEIFGRNVYIIGANDEKAIKKIQGLTLIGAYGDEIATWPESYFRMLLSRLSLPGAQFFGTTNPDSPHHWLKTDFIDKLKPPHMRKWHFVLEDNPYLPKDYVKALMEEYTGLWYRRYILGEWCLAEGAVYDMWDDKRHVVPGHPDPKGNHEYVVSIDYGTANPTAFLLMDIAGGTVVVEKEYYHAGGQEGVRQKTDAEYVTDLKEFMKGTDARYVILDPSALSFKVACRNAGIKVRDADNTVLDGIRLVSSLLTNDKLKVCAACPNLIKEFSGYLWDAKAQEKGEDKPMKKNDHALDALRYGVQTTMSRPAQPAVLRRFGI